MAKKKNKKSVKIDKKTAEKLKGGYSIMGRTGSSNIEDRRTFSGSAFGYFSAGSGGGGGGGGGGGNSGGARNRARAGR